MNFFVFWGTINETLYFILGESIYNKGEIL